MAARRGVNFQDMPKDRHREICAKGGASVPAAKRTFSDPEKARAAGRKRWETCTCSGSVSGTCPRHS